MRPIIAELSEQQSRNLRVSHPHSPTFSPTLYAHNEFYGSFWLLFDAIECIFVIDYYRYSLIRKLLLYPPELRGHVEMIEVSSCRSIPSTHINPLEYNGIIPPSLERLRNEDEENVRFLTFNWTNPYRGRSCSRLRVRRCSVRFCARFPYPARALPSRRAGPMRTGIPLIRP